MRGMSQGALAKIAGTYFLDDVFIERWQGNVDEIDTWEPQGTYKCLLWNRTSGSFLPDSNRIAYDATVAMVAKDILIDPLQRYRLTVTQWKARDEKSGDDSIDEPVEKRERVLKSVNVEMFQDVSGMDLFLMVRCADGDTGS